MHDSACPARIERDGCVRAVSVLIPKALLPFSDDRVRRVCGQRLSARTGVGALFAEFVTRLVRDADSYQAADGPRLGEVLIDLVSALVAPALEGTQRRASEDPKRMLTLRIQGFIQQHLLTRGLTPREVAAAHHISLSYLHRLFREQGATVASWIRRQRLERARRDLADPTLSATPIHAIAARWGFAHPADFSRAFRSAYGLPPSDYRQEVLG